LSNDITKYISKEELDMMKQIMTADEMEEIYRNYNPKKWAKDKLGWIARDYQEEVFDSILDTKQMVLRWGRRLGKSDSMAVLSLFFGDTQCNKDDTKGSYKVLIICPYDNQVDAIFDRMKTIVENSVMLQESITMRHHKFIFSNGSVIEGKTAGSKSNTGAASLRGQGADVVMFDEVDYMSRKDISNIMMLKKEAPDRIKFIAVSTPIGDRTMFYEWCTKAEELGWKHIHRSSLVSKDIYDVNPDNKLGLTYLEELKNQLTQLEFLHEVMAEFGESQSSLFQKRFLEIALLNGKARNWRYYGLDGDIPIKMNPRVLGVDWDKAAASTNMVLMELNRREGMIYVLNRVEIPSHEFTYTMAIEKIKELNDRYDPDWIFVDTGYGAVQIEELKLYGLKNPETRMDKKIHGVALGGKIDVRDPITNKKMKKDVKPFMVNNAVNCFEKQMIVLNPEDPKVVKQLEDYKIKSTSSNGRPTYTDVNEHIVDCIGFCLLAFEQKFGALFNIVMSTRILGINKNIDDESLHIVDANNINRIKSLNRENKGSEIQNIRNVGSYISTRKQQHTRIQNRRRF